MKQWEAKTVVLAGAMALANVPAQAAEGFEIRYNLTGSLGGEIFAPPNQSGWAFGAAATAVRIDKVTGGDGRNITRTVPGGVVPLPAPVPAALFPAYSENVATLDATGPMDLVKFGVAYVTSDRYGGGRLALGVNIPYGHKQQTVVANAATPGLHWSPAIPAATQAAAAAQFSSQYQAGIAAQASADTGSVKGFGDTELQGGWLYADSKLRVVGGASLILPTGKYSSNPGPDIGTGNFYTFRPAIQAAYLPTPEFGLAAKFTLGLNTRNGDNELRSGNWAGVELAAAYKTAIGVLGVHAIHAQQYQDDRNNVWGASRFRSTNAGAFFTTLVPGLNVPFTVQYMRTVSSHFAKHGDFFQARLIKFF